MLQIKDVRKKYVTGELVQTALDGVSLNLRDNEFVAVLGPSGSGKTTLLNIIGGLDRYDSGDLIINGISTKKYKDRDWDSYRNHTIGFVFQSYNLIPHQSVLANVELALTISGISKSERRKRAKEALEKVGLGNQVHKKPNQMSGGQMQRVAIARALVNNPDILLADEPTGALDSETSVQIMDLLKEVAKERLVVMVTHNPELAEEYATRIVRVKDGKIIDDSNPFDISEEKLAEPQHKNMGKSSMSAMTALSLSFNNLLTKKGRTLLTSFAGSIGIIGIAMILSFSNGVNNYINNIQKDTMTSYPIQIDAQTIDLSSMMSVEANDTAETSSHEMDGVYANNSYIEMQSEMVTSLTENNLTEFKKYLDDENSSIHQYIGENGIIYSYDTKFSIFSYDPDGTFINTNGSDLPAANMVAEMNGMTYTMGNSTSSVNAEQLMPGTDGELVSKAITDNYNLIYGEYPDSYDEAVIVLDFNNEIEITTLFELGILPVEEYKDIYDKLEAGEEIKLEERKFSYEEICGKDFYLIPQCDFYEENEDGTFTDISENKLKTEALAKDAVKLKITGVIKPDEDADTIFISQPIAYTKALTDYIMEYTDNSPVVKAQKEDENTNVLNGLHFAPDDVAAKIQDAKDFLKSMGVSDKAAMFDNMSMGAAMADPAAAEQMAAMDESTKAAQWDEMMKTLDDDSYLELYDAYISTGTYDENLKMFGVVSVDAPSSVSIYSDSFEDKDAISDCIEDYNKTVSEENKITYTDYVGLLMSSVTTIVNVISYVLIAFVGVSLVVSSIMIGIITYISVLERTKEIGILRAIGASKHNIAQVFNAETFIIGLCSGLIGIGVTLLLLIPSNAIIHAVADTENVNAALPFASAVILVILSVVLTLIGGIIPSKKAARKDPVTALRTE